MKQFLQNIKYLLEYKGIEESLISKKKLEKILFEKKKVDIKTAYLIAAAFGYKIDDLIVKDLSLIEQIKKNFDFKFFVTDVDGVMTDGGMYYAQSGDELKKFNTKDGMGIKLLLNEGIKVGFLSSGINSALIENRAKLLGVQYVYVGTWNKLEILTKWCEELDITLANVAYIGDDINDLEIIKQVGLSACPSDSVEKIKSSVDIVLTKNGGNACLREFIDNYLIN